MIAGLKPYAAMKDSGLPWLGAVPEHWGVLPLCAIARPRKQTNQPHRELLSVYLGRGVIPFSAAEEKRTNPTSEDLSKYQAVERGDFVLNNQQAWRGSVGVSRYQGIVSPAYLVLALDERLEQEFADRLLSGQAMVAQYLVSSRGVGSIQRNLYWPHLRRATVLVPPSAEQAAIVRFLNHADRRFRRYIRAKQNLIKLLEEQKHTIIHRAVTHGLDPNVRLKPSGVEWLGDVPEHWEVVRSKHVFVPRVDLAKPGDVQLSATQAYGVISQEEYERRVGRKIVKIFRHLEKRRHVEVDDFVISMRSFQGGLERAWEQGCIRSSYVVLQPRREVCVPYFARLFKSTGYIGALQATANFIRDGQDLNYENFCAVDLPWPPLAEQATISAAIDETLRNSSKAGERASQEIDLLREYRTRLFADVVTGKLDVREAAARLPDEVEDIETSDDVETEGNQEEGADEDGDEASEEIEE